MALIAAGTLFSPATARAELHNIIYKARIDGVAPGSQASFLIEDGQINSAPLTDLPNQTFDRGTVLRDPQKAGLRITLRWPYSANVHCEIDVDEHVFTQIDRRVTPAPANADPMNGVLQCGAPVGG